MRKVFCIGDCLTEGVYVEHSYPNQLQEILGKDYEVLNLGRTMLRAYNLVDFKELFLEKIEKEKTTIVIIWIGTNDIHVGNTIVEANKNMDRAYESNCAFSSFLESYDIKVILVTSLPRAIDTNMKNFWIEEKRIEFNKKLLESGRIVVNLDEIDGIGTPNSNEDKRYYLTDKTHLNEMGYNIVAKAISEKINGI